MRRTRPVRHVSCTRSSTPPCGGTSPQSSPRRWVVRVAIVSSSRLPFRPPGVPRLVASNASTASPSTRPRWRMIPNTPVKEAHVPSLLADAFSSVGALGVDDLADPERVRGALEDYECVVADAERDADLEALVRAVPDPARVLWAGSAGLALALGSVYPGPCAEDAGVQRAPVRPVLVVVGSLSGVAREQVRRLVGRWGGRCPCRR